MPSWSLGIETFSINSYTTYLKNFGRNFIRERKSSEINKMKIKNVGSIFTKSNEKRKMDVINNILCFSVNLKKKKESGTNTTKIKLRGSLKKENRIRKIKLKKIEFMINFIFRTFSRKYERLRFLIILRFSRGMMHKSR
jgi:hypothetical protein